MIPPSPPTHEESEDRDSGDDDSKPSEDPNIRFHVTLEEGDEDSVAAM